MILTEIFVLFWNQTVTTLVLGTAKYILPHNLKSMFSHRWYNSDLRFAFSRVALPVSFILIAFIYFLSFHLYYTVFKPVFFMAVHERLLSLYRPSGLILSITAWPVSQSFRLKLTGTWVLFQLKDKPALLAIHISTSKVKYCSQQ